MRFADIIGQERPVSILRSSLRSGDISHAYLFYGPNGIGKGITALNFAKALNCLALNDDSCDECINCKKFDSENFPDFLMIQPEDGKIKIEVIRDLQKKVSYRPYEGRMKVVLIQGAEDMTLNAANSFLKTLEEPADETVLILLCHNFNLLLPTIVSRCQRIQFNLISAEVIKNILVEKNQMKPEDAHLVASYSQGCLGKAMDMDIGDFVKKRNEVLNLMENISFNEIDLVFKKSKMWSSDSENVKNTLSAFLNIARDLAVLKIAENEKLITNLDIKDKLKSLIQTVNINQLILLFNAVEEGSRNIKRNINVRLLLDILLIQICTIFDKNIRE